MVDEPELGLHPYALEVIASLFQAASNRTQVLVSTQSSAFLNAFEPEDIVVVERNDEATEFIRPDAEKLDAWLDDYSLGEIWEKKRHRWRAADTNVLTLMRGLNDLKNSEHLTGEPLVAW